MLLFWGVLGIIQAVFLPGAALCSVIAPKQIGVARFISISFIFSLIANYVVASLLLMAGFYTKPIMITIFVMEIAILTIASQHGRLVSDQRPQLSHDKDHGIALEPKERENIHFLFNITFILAGLIILTFYHGFIFKHIDAILSWNYWASSWAVNSYPQTRGDYPQLMPIIIAIPYIFMGSNSLQVFSILSLELFLLPGLLALYTLKDSSRAYGAVAGAIGIVWLFTVTPVGYADVIVGILALMAFVILQWHLSILREGGQDKFYLYAAFGAAAASAVMKQAGLFWWPWFLAISVEGLSGVGLNRRSILKSLWLPLLLSMLVIFPWYVYNKYLIHTGSVPSMIDFFLTEPLLYHGHSFMGRAGYALVRYSYYSLFALAAIRGLFIAGYRTISASCLFGMAGWALFFSYGGGNAKFPVILSFMPLGACIQLAVAKNIPTRLVRRFTRLLAPMRATMAGVVFSGLGLLICFYLICSLASPIIDKALISSRNEMALKIGKNGLNKRIDYLERKNTQRILSTDGRLSQIASIPNGYVSVFSGGPVNILDYGYLVLNRTAMDGLDQHLLSGHFREDYAEKNSILFIRKDVDKQLFER